MKFFEKHSWSNAEIAPILIIKSSLTGVSLPTRSSKSKSKDFGECLAQFSKIHGHLYELRLFKLMAVSAWKSSPFVITSVCAFWFSKTQHPRKYLVVQTRFWCNLLPSSRYSTVKSPFCSKPLIFNCLCVKI